MTDKTISSNTEHKMHYFLISYFIGYSLHLIKVLDYCLGWKFYKPVSVCCGGLLSCTFWLCSIQNKVSRKQTKSARFAVKNCAWIKIADRETSKSKVVEFHSNYGKQNANKLIKV